MARRGLSSSRNEGMDSNGRGKAGIDFVTVKTFQAREMKRYGRERWQKEKKGAHAKRVAAVRKAQQMEVTVDTWNMRMMVAQGTNRVRHMAVLMAAVQKLGFDIIGLQKIKQAGQSYITVADYDVYLSGSTDAANRHGVGIPVRSSIVEERECVPEYTKIA